MTEVEWNRERIKKVLDVLRELKDFEKVPLPQSIHKEFDIPMAKPKGSNIMDYFERFMEIQKMPVDKVETIDGRVAHKDVVFPTSILEPCKDPYPELALDDTIERLKIHEEKTEEEEAEAVDLPELAIGLDDQKKDDE
jgi:hypothetical protein